MLGHEDASWATWVSIILLKLNLFLIIELNPFSCAAIDSKILSLARNFLLILSLICFWPYTRSFIVGWKLLLKFVPCCWLNVRLGLEFQPYWGQNHELGLLLLPTKFASSRVNGHEVPECPVSPHVSHVIRDSETWLTSWCGDSSFFMRRSILAPTCRHYRFSARP